MSSFIHLIKNTTAIFLFCINAASAADSYNPVNNQLAIPAVEVNGTIYRNVVITVGEILALNGGLPKKDIDIYDASNGQLSISSVYVGNSIYNNVQIKVGSIVSVGGTGSVELSKLDSSNVATIDLYKASGYNGTDLLFFNLLGKGDINGDGYEDLVIGLFRLSTSPSYSGRQFDPSGEIKPVVLFYNPNTDRYEIDSKLQSVIRTNQHPRQVAIADFDGDGRNDIFIADHGYDDGSYGNQNTLLLNKISGYEDGTKLLPQLSDFSHGLVMADFDGNGKPDLLVLNNTVDVKTKCDQYPGFKECSYTPQKYSESYVLFNFGVSGLKKGVLAIPDEIINFTKSNWERDLRLYVGHSADFNNDGKADLVISNHRNLFILESDSSSVGKFLPAQIFSPPTKCLDSNPYSAITSLDLDGDGVDEIIASNACDLGGAYFQVFKRDKNGIWTDKTDDLVGDQSANKKLTDGWCYKFEIYDLNADGVRDLICQSVRGFGTPSNNVIWYGGKKINFSNESLKDGGWASFETVVRNKDNNYILGFSYQMGNPDLTIKRWKIR